MYVMFATTKREVKYCALLVYFTDVQNELHGQHKFAIFQYNVIIIALLKILAKIFVFVRWYNFQISIAKINLNILINELTSLHIKLVACFFDRI